MLFFYFWVSLKNFFSSDTFYSSYYFCRTFYWNTLNRKMNMVVVSANFNENNIIALRNLNTYFFQTKINFWTKNNSPVFRRTCKMIQ